MLTLSSLVHSQTLGTGPNLSESEPALPPIKMKVSQIAALKLLSLRLLAFVTRISFSKSDLSPWLDWRPTMNPPSLSTTTFDTSKNLGRLAHVPQLLVSLLMSLA